MAVHSLHSASAVVKSLVPVPVVAVDIYSYGFEVASITDGWTAGTSSAVTLVSYISHGGTSSLKTSRSTGTGVHSASRLLTGLTAGRSYTFSVWYRSNGSAGATATTIAVSGVGSSTPYNATGAPFVQLSYSFIATSTSHTVTLSATTVSLDVEGFWDDILLTQNGYTGYADYPLDVKTGSLTLDRSYEPYIQATMTVVAPDAETLELITPLTGKRVTVTITESFGTGTEWNPVARDPVTRTFDLFMVGRSVDKKSSEVTIDLTSDETQLQLYKHPVPATERIYGLSVKAAVTYALAKIGYTLAAGAEDANVTSTPLDTVQTNLITNPSLEAGLANITYAGGTLSRVSTWAAHATYSAQLVGNASDSYITDSSTGMQYGMAVGKTYVLSATAKITVPGTGAAVTVPQRQRAITVFAFNGTTYTEFYSDPVPNYAGASARLSVEFTVPVGTVSLFVRYYLGHTAGTILWDAFRLSEKLIDSPSDQTNYFDGSTSSGLWADAWTGTANASTSTRTAVPNSDAMIWQPGVSGSDWIEPMLNQTGLHLWCDEGRNWRLKFDRTLPELVSISPDTSLTEATDSITLDNSSEYYDHVVLAFKGNIGSTGEKYTTYDTATSGTFLSGFYKEYDTAQPGVGGAANILAASQGKGRVFDLTAINNYLAVPGKNLVATIPDTPVQTGRIQSVTFSLDKHDPTMRVTSQGLTTTPPNAWVLAVGPWTAATGTWLAATGTN